MLTRDEVEKAIRDIIVQTLMLEDVAADGLPLHEEGFFDALGANSIDALEVLISVEEHFGFEFGDEQLRPDLLHTLDDFVTATIHHIAAGGPATATEGDTPE